MSSEEVGSLAGVRVAIVGGGVFGCTAALDLDAAGAMVDLYEAAPTILDRASRRNLMRLHRGYHYPRSVRTARLARDAAPGFERQYPTAISYVHGRFVRDVPEGGDMFESTGWYDDALVRTADGWRIAKRKCRMMWWGGNPAVLQTAPGVNVEHVLDALSVEGKAGRVGHISALLAD